MAKVRATIQHVGFLHWLVLPTSGIYYRSGSGVTRNRAIQNFINTNKKAAKEPPAETIEIDV